MEFHRAFQAFSFIGLIGAFDQAFDQAFQTVSWSFIGRFRRFLSSVSLGRLIRRLIRRFRPFHGVSSGVSATVGPKMLLETFQELLHYTPAGP
jgi:hypothetical protein